MNYEKLVKHPMSISSILDWNFSVIVFSSPALIPGELGEVDIVNIQVEDYTPFLPADIRDHFL